MTNKPARVFVLLCLYVRPCSQLFPCFHHPTLFNLRLTHRGKCRNFCFLPIDNVTTNTNVTSRMPKIGIAVLSVWGTYGAWTVASNIFPIQKCLIWLCVLAGNSVYVAKIDGCTTLGWSCILYDMCAAYMRTCPRSLCCTIDKLKDRWNEHNS